MEDITNEQQSKTDESELESGSEVSHAAEQKDAERPDTAGGREGTFSQSDEEDQDPLQTTWSPGSDQPAS